MQDGTIYKLLEAIKAYFENKLPDLKRVELFSGVFDDEEVKHFVTARNVVRLAFLGASNVEGKAGGEAILYASFAVYTVVSGSEAIRIATNRMEAMMALAVSAGLGEDEGFGVPRTMDVIPGEIQNLYSRDAGERGVAIFGASFVVPVVIGTPVFNRDLTQYDPTKFFLLQTDDGSVTELDPNADAINDADA